MCKYSIAVSQKMSAAIFEASVYAGALLVDDAVGDTETGPEPEGSPDMPTIIGGIPTLALSGGL